MYNIFGKAEIEYNIWCLTVTTQDIQEQFKTKEGRTFRGFSSEAIQQMQQSLKTEYGISGQQIAEAASYSMAMVVRYALGLSAQDGKVCAVVNDTLAGCVALATIRHLVNAGCEAQALLIVEGSELSSDLSAQIKPLTKMGVKLPDIGQANEVDQFTAFLSSSHNVIFGVHSNSPQADPFIAGISDLLNEERTPVHCIECPSGINPNTGAQLEKPLYASSTLSLGATLQGLHAGSDFVGRHYLCDISIPKQLYLQNGQDLSQLFSDQPVLQIFPIKQEE